MKHRVREKRGAPISKISVLATALLGAQAFAVQSPQVPLAGNLVPMFAQAMPTLSTQAGGTINTVNGNAPMTVRMCEFDSKILPAGTPLAAGATGNTRVWGYSTAGTCPTTLQDTYIGPVIVNTRGTPTTVTWINQLGNSGSTGVLAYKYSTDQTLHWADPLNLNANGCSMAGGMGAPAFGSACADNYNGPIPAVVHLHGGEVPPEIDGNPLAYFTSDGTYHGPAYYSLGGGSNTATYAYPNTQEAGAFWFHDHTLGVTRLNVNAGMAGVYYLQDPAQVLPANLPPISQVIPLVLQDRSFDEQGQLYFPADSSGGVLNTPNPDHPYWVPEFVGDVNVVNGKAWPFFNVDGKRYRFLLLNGSNARTYSLSLSNARGRSPDIWVIATDGGYLDTPVRIGRGQTLNIMPGERYEVIIDFADFQGQSLTLTNTAAMPFPFGGPVVGTPMASVMQFRVSRLRVRDTSYKPSNRVALRAATQSIVRLANPVTGTAAVVPAKTRQLTLNEVMGMGGDLVDPVTGTVQTYLGGPLEVLINNTKWSGMSPRTNGDFTTLTVGGTAMAYSELPKEGDTEIWEIVNMTADAHPIHLHLVQYQLINRQAFDTVAWQTAYEAAFPSKAFEPAYGPPMDYRAANNPLSAGKDGGNPDVTPYLLGPAVPPLAHEAGWKDTLIMYPGDVTRIAVRYAPTDLPVTAPAASLAYPFDPSGGMQYGYVLHCHILDHEDNEMMRPKMVQRNPAAPAPTARRLVKGVNY